MTLFTAYNMAYLLSQALGVFAVYKLMRAFFEERKASKSIEMISYVGYYILTSSVYLIFNIPLMNLVVSVLSYFLLTLLYCSSIKKRFLVSLLVYIFGFCPEMITVTLTGYINFPVNEVKDYDSIFGIVAVNIFIFAVSMVASGFKNVKNDDILPKSYWAALLIMPISSLLVLALLFKSDSLSAYEIAASIAAILIIDFMVFFLFDRMSKLYREKQESLLIKQQNEYYVNQLLYMENLNKASSDVRHDIKNHLLTIYSYIENSDYTEAKKYISNIVDVYQSKVEIVNTGYPAIDGLLNFKFQSAIEEGIKISVRASLPSGLVFSSFDLTVILGNLIDNALEAVALVPENRFIDFRMNCLKGMLIIRVSNPYIKAINRENGKIITSKSDKKNHGMGLRNVNEALEKYNGTTEIETDENIFKITAALYLEQN